MATKVKTSKKPARSAKASAKKASVKDIVPKKTVKGGFTRKKPPVFE